MVVSANNSGAIWQFCNKSENKQLKKNEQEGIRKDAKCTEPRKQARDQARRADRHHECARRAKHESKRCDASQLTR